MRSATGRAHGRRSRSVALKAAIARGVAVGHVDIVPAVEQLIAADRIDAEA